MISTEFTAARESIPDIQIAIGESLVALDYVCAACNGEKALHPKMDPPCPKCKGLGRIPSQTGASILVFIRRHLGDNNAGAAS